MEKHDINSKKGQPIIKYPTLVESYKMASLRGSYGLYGQRTLVKLIEFAQRELEGRDFASGRDIRQIDVKTETKINTDAVFTFSMNEICPRKDFADCKKQLVKLMGRVLHCEDAKGNWKARTFINAVDVQNDTWTVTMKLSPDVWEAIMDFTKGFRKFPTAPLLKFQSVYTLKLYQLIGGRDTPICYTIEELRKFFAAETEYVKVDDFIRRTIVTAQKEMNKFSDWTFEFQKLTDRDTIAGRGRGNSCTKILFFPKRVSENYDATAEHHSHRNTRQVKAMFTADQLDRLKYKFDLSLQSLANNIDLLVMLQKKVDFDSFVDKIAEVAANTRPANRAGFFIKCAKVELGMK